MNDVLTVANYILTSSQRKGYPLDNLKLNNLLFVLYTFSIYAKKPKLFEAEFKYGDYGFIVDSVYKRYQAWEQGDIFYHNHHDTLSIDEKRLINTILYKYSDSTGWDLITHCKKIAEHFK